MTKLGDIFTRQTFRHRNDRDRELGGGVTPNWMVFSTFVGDLTLTPGDGSHHSYGADEIDMQAWSGQYSDVVEPNDFTVHPSYVYSDILFEQPVVRSAKGGHFQATLMARSPATDGSGTPNPALVLDESSGHLRYLWTGLCVGQGNEDGLLPEGRIFDVGVDLQVPLLVGLENQTSGQTATSSIGYTPPGGIVLSNFGSALIGGVGDDVVPLQGLVQVCSVYQVG
jgi:hypothetical protein